MPSSHHYYTLFTILLLSQLHLGLSNFCAQGQYYISSSSTCVDQTIITANIRPTLTPLVYLLVFEGGTVPYGDLTDFSSNVTFTLTSTVETITTNPQAFVASEVDGLSVLQVIILGVDVPYDTTLTVTFADLSNNEGAASVVKSPIQILFPSNKDLSSSDANLVDVITDIDFILEIVWIVVSLLNPYWIIYMDCKLYRETLDLFKQVSVQYQPFLYSFYLANTRKTAGLRIYNFFAMYVFGDSNRNSDWKKYQWTGLGIDGIDTDRIQDTKVLVNSQFFQYNDFALFFDNFGSEIVVLIACLILALLFETNFRLLKQNSNSTYRTISTGVRQLFWNLLFMTALGSCQTLTYYAAIQFQAFTSEMTTNSKIGFGCAIAAVLLILGGLCTYVIISSKKKVFVNKMNHNPQNGPLTFFSWILEFYKAQKLIEPLMILIVIVRSIVFSVIIITLNSNPAIQTGVMLGTTLTCMIAMILVKPFARKLYMVFKLAYEFVILLALIILVVLAVRDNEGTFNTDERSILNVILISLWIAPPVLTIIFGAVGLIMYVKEAKWGTGEKRSVKITPVNEERKVINKKKVFEEHTTVRFADSPIYEVPAEQKPAQIFQPVPSAGVKNFEVPPVSILKPPARAEAMQTNRTEVSDSNANLLQNNKSAHSISMLNPQGNQAPGKLPASSLVLDQQNNATRSPPYADKRNSMFNIGAQRGFGNRIVPVGEQQRPTTINATNRLEPQGEQQRSHIRNNSTNTIANKSAFSRGGEQPRVRTDVLGVPNRAPFEVMELKLTPQSLRVIDQDGFKEYISKEDGDHGNYVSSRNNMF